MFLFQPTNCLGVYIDDDPEFKTTVCGIPDLSNNTNIVLSVWNWKNFLLEPNETSSGLTHWQTAAVFSNLVTPAPSESPCRYGDPFRGGQNPIVRYEAGVGSSKGLADVVSFREVMSVWSLVLTFKLVLFSKCFVSPKWLV